MRRELILLVDDEPEIRALLSKFLIRAGFLVEEAGTAAAAREAMRRRFHNIVLLDIRLPDADGKELLQHLREINPLTNVVMITGFTSMDNVVHCLGAGAVDYFTKPFSDLGELLEAIEGLDRKIARWKRSTPLAR
jgi:DNA-binding response OmpR family regulator